MERTRKGNRKEKRYQITGPAVDLCCWAADEQEERAAEGLISWCESSCGFFFFPLTVFFGEKTSWLIRSEVKDRKKNKISFKHLFYLRLLLEKARGEMRKCV